MPVQQLLGHARNRHGRVDIRAGPDLLRRQLDGDRGLVVPRLHDCFRRHEHLSSGQPFAGIDDQIPYTPHLVVKVQVVDGTNLTVQGIDVLPISRLALFMATSRLTTSKLVPAFFRRFAQNGVARRNQTRTISYSTLPSELERRPFVRGWEQGYPACS